MNKRLEVSVRMVDGAQLHWDASVCVDLPQEAIVHLMPLKGDLPPTETYEGRAAGRAASREKFLTAAALLWDRAMVRVGR